MAANRRTRTAAPWLARPLSVANTACSYNMPYIPRADPPPEENTRRRRCHPPSPGLSLSRSLSRAYSILLQQQHTPTWEHMLVPRTCHTLELPPLSEHACCLRASRTSRRKTESISISSLELKSAIPSLGLSPSSLSRVCTALRPNSIFLEHARSYCVSLEHAIP